MRKLTCWTKQLWNPIWFPNLSRTKLFRAERLASRAFGRFRRAHALSSTPENSRVDGLQCFRHVLGLSCKVHVSVPISIPHHMRHAVFFDVALFVDRVVNPRPSGADLAFSGSKLYNSDSERCASRAAQQGKFLFLHGVSDIVAFRLLSWRCLRRRTRFVHVSRLLRKSLRSAHQHRFRCGKDASGKSSSTGCREKY